ncbi:MAG TPA: cupin domain-containing protein [Gemmatimonadetes bacterium]|nr:cupin domain-containing protein [Gemmatimonadota bacterium]
MAERTEYHINLDVKFAPLELIDLPGLVEECSEDWFNQTLTRVNDSVVRLGILKGEFHWHEHNDEDEFFFPYTLDFRGRVYARLIIDVEGRDSVSLGPKQGFTVPKRVMHRTRAPEGVVVLMVEGTGVVPMGD